MYTLSCTHLSLHYTTLHINCILRRVDTDPDYVWNTHGNGLLLQSVAVPVVLLSGADAQQAWQFAIANRDSSSSSNGSGVHTYPRHVISAEYYFGRSGLNSKVTSLMLYRCICNCVSVIAVLHLKCCSTLALIVFLRCVLATTMRIRPMHILQGLYVMYVMPIDMY
jgi:hypothetical protein